MTDDDLDPELDDRFKVLDRLDPPDVWSSIAPSSPLRGGAGRRRPILAAAAVFAALLAIGFTISRWSDPEQDDVVAAGTIPPIEQERSTPSESAGIATPDVVGLSLQDAVRAVEIAGLRSRVVEDDPDFGPAVILAQEPAAGFAASAGDVIELRTVVPDPPAFLECPSGQHPRVDVGADALPPVDAVSRANAEQAVVELRGRLGNPVFLGQWNRWAWQRVDGEVDVVPVEGFHVIVVADGPDCGPIASSYINGVPVTEVKGPLGDFVAGLDREPFASIVMFEVDLPSTWAADTTPEADLWRESMTGDGGGFFRARVMDRPDRSAFIEFVDPDSPSLEEAARQMTELFPSEFGQSPTLAKSTVDGREGWRISPSPDAASPGTVTYLFEPPGQFRFIEIAMDSGHEASLMAGFRWLPEDPPEEFGHLATSEDLISVARAAGYEVSVVEVSVVEAPVVEASLVEVSPAPIGAVIDGRLRRVCLAGGLVRVFEFDSVSLRVVESDRIRPDGQPPRAVAAWVATPRFYAADRLIALYVGDRSETFDALAQLMGPTLSPDATFGRGKAGVGENCEGELVASSSE
jgi:PASTA domain-containing protein